MSSLARIARSPGRSARGHTTPEQLSGACAAHDRRGSEDDRVLLGVVDVDRRLRRAQRLARLARDAREDLVEVDGRADRPAGLDKRAEVAVLLGHAPVQSRVVDRDRRRHGDGRRDLLLFFGELVLARAARRVGARRWLVRRTRAGRCSQLFSPHCVHDVTDAGDDAGVVAVQLRPVSASRGRAGTRPASSTSMVSPSQSSSIRRRRDRPGRRGDEFPLLGDVLVDVALPHLRPPAR